MIAALRVFALFVGARAASYVVDMGGMLLLVNLLHVHNAVAKILTNILVVIINYFFSKWFIFNRDAKQPPTAPARKTKPLPATLLENRGSWIWTGWFLRCISAHVSYIWHRLYVMITHVILPPFPVYCIWVNVYDRRKQTGI